MIKHVYSATLLALTLGFGSVAAFAQTAPAAPADTYTQASPNPAPRDPALKPDFAKFGGKAGLVAIVHDFMDNLMADPRTHPFFANVDREHVKKELVDQFCVILDGPCTYTGQNMTAVHKGMNVNRTNFNALVEDLQKAMEKHDVPFHAQNALLAKLAPMHHQIITQK